MNRKQIEIMSAINNFECLKSCNGDPDFRIWEIRRHLKSANANAAVLDPAGRKTADEMEVEIREAKRFAHVQFARHHFRILQEGKVDLDYRASMIRANLSEAGVNASALDPAGGKSADEMEAEIRDAMQSTLDKKYGIGSKPGRSK